MFMLDLLLDDQKVGYGFPELTYKTGYWWILEMKHKFSSHSQTLLFFYPPHFYSLKFSTNYFSLRLTKHKIIDTIHFNLN